MDYVFGLLHLHIYDNFHCCFCINSDFALSVCKYECPCTHIVGKFPSESPQQNRGVNDEYVYWLCSSFMRQCKFRFMIMPFSFGRFLYYLLCCWFGVWKGACGYFKRFCLPIAWCSAHSSCFKDCWMLTGWTVCQQIRMHCHLSHCLHIGRWK